MKKLIFTLCALCLCGTMWADTIGEDIQKDEATGLYFATVSFDNATTTSVIAIISAQDGDSYSLSNLVQNTDGTYTLPATVQAEGGEEVALQGVAASAFASVLTDTTNPIHLVIPANIIELGSEAFNRCTQIEEVTVEYSATALDEAHNTSYNSFNNCSSIKTVTMNRDITIHRNNNQTAYMCFPFCKLPSIQTVYIGEYVTTLANNAFNANGTSQLSAVYCYATDHVPTLANQCFLYQAEGCTLYVYDSLVENFQSDTNGTNGWADIFTNIQGMGNPELEEGTYLDLATSLYFEINEDGTTASIYHDEAGIYTDANLVVYSYDDQGEPNAYTLPETVSADGVTYYDVTRIEAYAFENSSISGHIVIPSYINNLGTGAFRACTEITEVTYEYSETPIYDECPDSNLGDECFINCSNLATVNLYRDVTLAGGDNVIDGSFAYHTAISTINIGPRVKEIPHHMFNTNSNSYSLTTINCYAINPPALGTAAFRAQYLNSSFVVNVPFGTEEAYLSDDVWTSMFVYENSGYTLAGHIKEMSNAFAITTHDNNEGTAYATFYNSASDVELFNPDGDTELTAYVAYKLDEETDGLYIEIESIGNVVPAGTGVIVETENEGTYLAIATSNGESYSGNNDLYGFDTAQECSQGEDYLYYLLSSNDGVVGFYWGAENGGAFTCQAHRAYLALDKDAVNESSGISIRKGNGGEDTTGISSVESATEGTTVKGIYTIQGIRVSNMNQPGLYIVDGKKIIKR